MTSTALDSGRAPSSSRAEGPEASATSSAASANLSQLLRHVPLLAGGGLGLLWLLAFHDRVHAGSSTGAGPMLNAHPDLLQGSASAFLAAFTVGSAAIWMPCILQMLLVFSGLTAADAQRFRGGRFFAAYIGTYAALGVVAAAFGEVLARLEVIVMVQVAGGAAMAFVGLSLVGVLHTRRVMRACGSAMGFAMKGGRVHRLGQARIGVAFAVYCAGCCGPLLIPLYLFAAASGSLLLGTVASAAFALAMAIPVAILGLIGHRWTSLLRGVVDNYDVITRTAGMALLTLGLLLVLNRPLIAVIDALHALVGE
jgi:cytochrome c-type biogenesis protein